MFKEIISDSENMIRWGGHHVKALRRLSLKAKSFPISCDFTHVTPRRNRWTILFVILGKIRSVQDIYNVLYTSLLAPEGDIYLLVQPTMKQKMSVCIYPPHFWHRFKERMGLEETGKDLAKRYFTYNDSGHFVPKPDSEHEECLCTRDGIALGEFINDRMFVARTFIRYDMSLGWQREAFEKQRKRFGCETEIIAVSKSVCRNSQIKEVYRKRDRKQPIVFHH